MQINVNSELVATSMRSKSRASIKGHFTPANNSSCSSNNSSSSSSSNSFGDGDDTEMILADLCSSQTAQVSAVIKSAIWIFRSSVNTHKLWPPSLLLHLLLPTSPVTQCRRRLNYDLPLTSNNKNENKNGAVVPQGTADQAAAAAAAAAAVEHSLPTLTKENSLPTLTKEQTESLKRKVELAPYWGVICPAVKACCEERKRELEWRLAQYYKLHSL